MRFSNNKRIEKEQNYDDNREYWIMQLEMCWMKTLEAVKFAKMELDAIEYNKNNPIPNRDELPKKKIETFQIKDNKVDFNEVIARADSKLVKNLRVLNPFVDATALDANINRASVVKETAFISSNQPTMTLAEFADKEMARMKEQEERQQNAPVVDDDSDNEEVADRKQKEAREWDDWKDTVERGGGNKNNTRY